MSKNSDDKLNGSQPVDLGRRGIAKAGLAAPVIMTLVSKPVFGAQCLSQIMSGNISPHVGEGSCSLGKGNAFWKDPASIDDWETALGVDSYGVQRTGTTGEEWRHYTGGALFSDYFTGATSKKMRRVLNKNNLKNVEVNGGGASAKSKFWIAAYLNSKFSPDYILTPEQVLCLWDGTQSVPPSYTDLNDFFKSTWGL